MMMTADDLMFWEMEVFTYTTLMSRGLSRDISFEMAFVCLSLYSTPPHN